MNKFHLILPPLYLCNLFFTKVKEKGGENINNLEIALKSCPNNIVIFDSFVKTDATIPNYKKVLVAVSGGSDSDIVVDLFTKLFSPNDIEWVWYDTGIEYQATKDHLTFLENKYNIQIKRVKAIKPIPVSCKEYGQPFINKYVSEMIYRLQKHNFKFEDKPFDELLAIYPHCKVALLWWCNLNGEGSSFNINHNKGLKEFLVKNPPEFKISNMCCQYAKKKVAHKYASNNNIDLNVVGVRRSEGGIRSVAYTTCLSNGSVSEYRPIFWYRNADKQEYNAHYQVVNSICYSGYGMSRTGCAGCPFAKDFEEEPKIIQEHEPKLYQAVINIFGDSYEYSRKYKEYIKQNSKSNRITLFDFM